MTVLPKDPAARADHAIDWGADYLGSHAIVGSVWIVTPNEPGGLTVAAASFTATRTAVTLTGGRPGGLYDAANRITLSNGEIDTRSLSFRVEAR